MACCVRKKFYWNVGPKDDINLIDGKRVNVPTGRTNKNMQYTLNSFCWEAMCVWWGLGIQ